MTNLALFIGGIAVGIAGMIFLVLLWGVLSEFTKLKWHDARYDAPSDYNTSKGIAVLVRLSSGRIEVTSYFPEVQSYACMYDVYRNEAITHWAYAIEVGNTVPKQAEPISNDYCHAI